QFIGDSDSTFATDVVAVRCDRDASRFAGLCHYSSNGRVSVTEARMNVELQWLHRKTSMYFSVLTRLSKKSSTLSLFKICAPRVAQPGHFSPSNTSPAYNPLAPNAMPVNHPSAEGFL